MPNSKRFRPDTSKKGSAVCRLARYWFTFRNLPLKGGRKNLKICALRRNVRTSGKYIVPTCSPPSVALATSCSLFKEERDVCRKKHLFLVHTKEIQMDTGNNSLRCYNLLKYSMWFTSKLLIVNNIDKFQFLDFKLL